uniref:G protein-coupled receptor n=1 Tax=Caenorhabditis tropicalis TaxID=1561998 RepID=A0A1I7UBA7_9PELO
MSDREWLGITTYSDYIGFTISTITNFLLLFFLVIRPTKALGSYKFLMITFCVFSLFYTSIETFLRPLIHIYDNTIFVIQRKRFQYSETVARSISSTYCGCYAMSFTLFAVHFVYRYYATCKQQHLKYFKGCYFVAWILVAMLVAGSWGFAAFILYPETERTKAALLHVLKTSYDLDPTWIGNVPYSYFRTENGIEYLNPRNVIGILQHGLIMTVSFGTVFYCGYQTHKTMQATRGISDRTRDLQNQLFTALVLQVSNYHES